MSKAKVLILGATGHVGKLICAHLKNDPSVELIVASRKHEQLNELSQLYGKAVYIDLDIPETFPNALKGIQRLFLLTGYSVSMVVQSKTIIDAAISAGVDHIVHLGVFAKPNCTVPHFAWHQMIEVYIKNAPVKWTFLHPNCFLQNITAFSILLGKNLRWYTSKPCGWIALEDVAESAAKILNEGPQKHHGKDYWFSTESLDIHGLAAALSEATGTRITAQLRSPDLFIPDIGADPKTLDPYFFSVAESCKQIEDGRMAYIGDVRDDVSILLNRKGITAKQWAALHQTELMGLVNKNDNRPMDWGAPKVSD